MTSFRFVDDGGLVLHCHNFMAKLFYIRLKCRPILLAGAVVGECFPTHYLLLPLRVDPSQGICRQTSNDPQPHGSAVVGHETSIRPAPQIGQGPVHGGTAAVIDIRAGAARPNDVTAEVGRSEVALAYLKSVQVIEALVESLPQLILSIWIFLFFGELKRVFFYITAGISIVSLVKALITFWSNRATILSVIQRLSTGTQVVAFECVLTGQPARNGWQLATAAQVEGNLKLAKEARYGTNVMGDYFICTLADEMELLTKDYGWIVQEKTTIGGGHVLYCLVD